MTGFGDSRLLRVCAQCPMLEICKTSGKQMAIAHDGAGIHICRKGRSIYYQGSVGGQVHILREGWAFRFTVLPNGRRQILEFLLPGDPILLPLLFVSRLPYTVHALTDAKLCTFALKEITDQAQVSREATRRIEIVCATGLVGGEARLAEINQRNSQERTAWLLLSLFHELKRRGYAEGDVVPFPLGLAHIADALGITITHASRTLGTLRREGLISLARERLTVHNKQDLANVALLPMAATGE
ncbi:MAG: Crp/Fnr family transcriptional regulator [Methylovirgula sp.]|uniref:Crp/Fnr family transcriptional regulator n=1 Tax=Methylovirgula sp. TaxID=1978224 RepID=UPI0030767414